jgi:CBS domain-containing protein/mannitol/fructose-specific phosphotransferase system IIA component (Ntr-type)
VDAVRTLLGRLAESGAIADADAAARALLGPHAREIPLIAPGVVLPHLRTDAVDALVVALGVSPKPLAMRKAGDEGPRIVALILAPPHAASFYLQTVAALAGLLRKENVVERIIAARSADEVLAIPHLAALKVEGRLNVGDIMVHRPASVGPDVPVRDAVEMMVRERVRALPVVGSKDEVLGIVTEWDVMRGLLPQIPRTAAAGGEENAAPLIRVRDIMTRSVLCIAEELGLDEAARMMINKDVEQFPVTSEGKLTGFISRGDIIRKLFGR